jgi:hypothetical protein
MPVFFLNPYNKRGTTVFSTTHTQEYLYDYEFLEKIYYQL